MSAFLFNFLQQQLLVKRSFTFAHKSVEQKLPHQVRTERRIIAILVINDLAVNY